MGRPVKPVGVTRAVAAIDGMRIQVGPNDFAKLIDPEDVILRILHADLRIVDAGLLHTLIQATRDREQLNNNPTDISKNAAMESQSRAMDLLKNLKG